jgi:hypothetical protein
MEGRKEWYMNGQLHCSNGPAVIYASGSKKWYKNGPAIIRTNGNKQWYINGKLHRLDGTAIEHANGTQHYYEMINYYYPEKPVNVMFDVM